jgi:hypothetical protein
MATKLEDLLESIDPRRTLDENYRRAMDVLNRLRIPRDPIAKWDEYRHFVGELGKRLDEGILGVRGGMPEMSDDFYYGRACQRLVRIYGSQGDKIAFEYIRTGVEGGLNEVIKRMAMDAVEEYTENEIQSRIHDYYNGLDMDEKLAAAEEYLEKFGHLLPEELVEGSGCRVKANLPAVLAGHHRLMRQLGRLGL